MNKAKTLVARLLKSRSSWSFGGRTDRGLVRTRNEDTFQILEDGNILIVADGMGGHRGGDVASRVAVDEMVRYYTERGGGSMGGNHWQVGDHLIRAVRRANEAIIETVKGRPELEGMGCTLIAGVLVDEILHTCHLGDVRCYVANTERIEQITRDHSYVAGVLNHDGEVSDVDARTHPLRNVITRALGFPLQEDPDYNRYSLQSESRVLLCSDGLWSMWPERLPVQ